jgi:hypothetical protein
MMSRRPQQPSGMSVSLAGGAPRRAPCGSLRRMATQWGVPNRCKVQAIRDPLGACGGWHGREKAVERSQPAHPQTAHHHSSCRRHPQACGADRHQAPASKPDPRPEVDVGHGGDGRQLRRGRANRILHLRAATASTAARLIRATARRVQERRLTPPGDKAEPAPAGRLTTPHPHRGGIACSIRSAWQCVGWPRCGAALRNLLGPESKTKGFPCEPRGHDMQVVGAVRQAGTAYISMFPYTTNDSLRIRRPWLRLPLRHSHLSCWVALHLPPAPHGRLVRVTAG